MIRIARVYEQPGKNDGWRVLVDRLWPRGLKKEAARVDEWMKEIAPADQLRKWFAHKPERWPEFQKRYRAELQQKKAAVEELRQKCRREAVTLVYAARDEEHNSALLLKQYLESSAAD